MSSSASRPRTGARPPGSRVVANSSRSGSVDTDSSAPWLCSSSAMPVWSCVLGAQQDGAGEDGAAGGVLAGAAAPSARRTARAAAARSAARRGAARRPAAGRWAASSRAPPAPAAGAARRAAGPARGPATRSSTGLPSRAAPARRRCPDPVPGRGVAHLLRASPRRAARPARRPARRGRGSSSAAANAEGAAEHRVGLAQQLRLGAGLHPAQLVGADAVGGDPARSPRGPRSAPARRGPPAGWCTWVVSSVASRTSNGSPNRPT